MKQVKLTIDGEQISVNVLEYAVTNNLLACTLNTTEFEKFNILETLSEESKVVFPKKRKKVFVEMEDDEKSVTYKTPFNLTNSYSDNSLTTLIFTKFFKN